MRIKELALPIDPDSPETLCSQIVQGMASAIREGRLLPGTLLPGYRSLAEQLNVSRITVVAALGELRTRGWVTSKDRSGTYVAERIPDDRDSAVPEPAAGSSPMAFDLPTRQDLATSQMIKIVKLSGGLPDSRLFPSSDLGRAYQEVIKGDHGLLWVQDPPEGHQELRETLCDFLAERRGIAAQPEGMLLTRGNRMALNIIALTLLKPGDRVAVEEPGNPLAWERFRESKADLIGIPVDEEGLDVDILEKQILESPIQLLYVSPRFQVPSTATLSDIRRKRLLELAQEHRFLIVEEDSEAEYVFDGLPSPSLAHKEGASCVLHLFSFSRVIAPGVRLGFIVGPPPVIARLSTRQQSIGWEGDLALEKAMCVLLKDGAVQRHLLRARRTYQTRRDVTLDCLEELFEDRLTASVPRGGLSLWIRSVSSVDLDAWKGRCAQQGIYFQTGSSFTLDKRPLPAFRLGYAAFESEEMAMILERMKQCF